MMSVFADYACPRCGYFAPRGHAIDECVKNLREGEESAVRFAEKCDREVDKLRAERDQLTAELAALKDRMEGVCRWSLENDDYNIWKGDCGAEWTLETDDPVTNGMNYCPKCGKHLEQIDPEPPEAE